MYKYTTHERGESTDVKHLRNIVKSEQRIMILIRAARSASLKLPAGSISHLKSN